MTRTPSFVVPVRDLVGGLSADPRFAPQIAALRRLPAAPARPAPWPALLAPPVRRAAAALGFDDLYTHQAAAASLALAGGDVAQVAGTAAGKSLGYLLPVFDALVRDPRARALLVFPTKALAQDQLERLRQWQAALPEHDLTAAAYDGDTPSSARARVRRTARIVVTNPDMLHAGILPRHTAWSTWLAGLTDVVVDEMHVYRGVFGSHVAHVLRRLRRVAAFHGARPRFHLTSATIANPGELARLLTGRPVAVVDDDGAPRSARTFVVYNPPIVDDVLNLRRSPVLEAEALARHFLDGGVQTIVFAGSRHSTELIVRYLNEGGDAPQRPPAAAPGGPPGPGTVPAPPRVRGYRGGYTPGERRAIEAALRDGTLQGVVATNALELGIDIGTLDACIIAGYPGTIASTWQQAGRAGRRAGEAAAVLVLGGSPIDQFFARHPDYFFGRSPEHARLDPDNLLILMDHLRCAAFELPFEAGAAPGARDARGDPAVGADRRASVGPATDAAIDIRHAVGRAVDADPPGLGGAALAPEVDPYASDSLAASLLDVLESRGELRRSGGRRYWVGGDHPAGAIGLRSAGPGRIAVVAPTGDGGGEDVLGTVEPAAAPVTVHPGAVYLHDGNAWQVVSLDLDTGRAAVVPADGSIYTRASARTDLRPVRTLAEREERGARVAHGELEVRTRASGYRKVRFRTHETVGWGTIDLPEQSHVAGGYWFTLDDATLDGLRAIGRWDFDLLTDRGPNWREQAARARARDGFRCRMCDAPERDGRAHDVHHIRPFRQFGWVKGANDRYREANVVENLITLCPGCHRTAERALGLHGGLSGVGYALAHLAPLFLMCDARDLGVTAESHAPWTGRPTVAIYERAAAGVGFGAALYDLHAELLQGGRDLIADCPCAVGCPACVGPADEGGRDAKGHALAVLRSITLPG